MYKVEYFNNENRVVETQALTLEYIGLTENEKTMFQYMEAKGFISLELPIGDKDQDHQLRKIMNMKFESNRTVYSITK